MKALFLLAVAILMAWAIVYSTRRDLQAFDEHMRIQDSLDVAAKRSRDSLALLLHPPAVREESVNVTIKLGSCVKQDCPEWIEIK